VVDAIYASDDQVAGAMDLLDTAAGENGLVHTQVIQFVQNWKDR